MVPSLSPAPQLTCDDLLHLRPSLQAHLEHFRPLFPRRDQAVSFDAYAEGLLSEERRKSIERMVLRQLEGDMNQVRRLQYFVADSPWSDQPFLERHWQAVGGRAGHARGHPAGGHHGHAQAGGAFGGGGPAVLRSAGQD